MIWIALLLGIFLGWLAHEVTGFILLHPMASVEKYRDENAELSKTVATQAAQIEALLANPTLTTLPPCPACGGEITARFAPEGLEVGCQRCKISALVRS